MNQRIILGGAYKLIKDVPYGSVDLVFTDPPYIFDGINFVGWKGSCKSDIDTPAPKNGIDNASMLPELVRVLKKRGVRRVVQQGADTRVLRFLQRMEIRGIRVDKNQRTSPIRKVLPPRQRVFARFLAQWGASRNR